MNFSIFVNQIEVVSHLFLFIYPSLIILMNSISHANSKEN